MTADDNFLARWARRKAEIAKAEDSARAPDAPPPDGDPAAADEEPFDLAALPSLDDLTASTDIRPFMHRLVPADLRNAALRRVWELDPAIRDYVSPATEYAWDFNAGGGAPGYGPLDAGFDAVKAAAKMFSGENTDTTLVDDAEAENKPAAFAGAKAAEQPAEAAAEQAHQIVELKTVRISTESSTAAGLGTQAPGPDRVSQLAISSPDSMDSGSAPQQNRPRHGGARPQ